MPEFKKYFTLSYDDGLEQDKQTIALMKKYGIRGTFNLNSAMLGEKSNIEYVGTIGFKNVDPSIVKKGLSKPDRLTAFPPMRSGRCTRVLNWLPIARTM